MRQKISKARVLRREATDAERKLWRYLRDRRLGGHRFRRQTPLGRYTVDFVCMEAKLIVEVDGGQHAERAMQDRARTDHLARGRFRVLRFWNDDVLLRTDAVLEAILKASTRAFPHPDPLPHAGEGEGR